MNGFQSQTTRDRTSYSLNGKPWVARETLQPRSKNGCASKPEVAALTTDAIGSMSRDELLDVIVAGRLPLLSGDAASRLEDADRPTLERLARLARRSCRRQGY